MKWSARINGCDAPINMNECKDFYDVAYSDPFNLAYNNPKTHNNFIIKGNPDLRINKIYILTDSVSPSYITTEFLLKGARLLFITNQDFDWCTSVCEAYTYSDSIKYRWLNNENVEIRGLHGNVQDIKNLIDNNILPSKEGMILKNSSDHDYKIFIEIFSDKFVAFYRDEYNNVKHVSEGEFIQNVIAGAQIFLSELFHKDVSNKLDNYFVKIPAGIFVMGSPEDEEPPRSKMMEGQHCIYISKSFEMMKYPMTNQIISLVKNEKSEVQFPLELSCYEDYLKIVKNLNDSDKKYFYRLPTEAEWEYACRAGTTGPHYDNLNDIAWYSGNSEGKIHEVGLKKPNQFGLYDMLGNVWELTSDVFSRNYITYKTKIIMKPFGMVVDPGWCGNPGTVRTRVAKGGDFANHNPRAALRLGIGQAFNGVGKFGFRLVRFPISNQEEKARLRERYEA